MTAPDDDAAALRVLVVSLPAYGHYMTIRDLAVGLAARGHAVTFALCERNRAVFDADAAEGRVAGVLFLSAGPCPSFAASDETIRALIARPGDLGAIARVLSGVADIAREMCDVLLPGLLALPSDARPHVILFDADTYCGMDLGHALRVPAVARVGTLLRDLWTTPLYAPMYGSGTGAPVGALARTAHAASMLVMRAVAPVLLPRTFARDRAHFARVADTAAARGAAALPAASDDAATAGVPRARVAAAAALLRAQRTVLRADLPWDGAPQLFNTHWGFEYPRPTMPYEHVVGHTTDFDAEARRPLPPAVATWLAAAPDVPVVLLSMGTLASLPPQWLRALGGVVTGNGTGVRWLWVAARGAVAASLPPAALAESDAWAALADAAARRQTNGADDAAPGCDAVVDDATARVAAAAPADGATTHTGTRGAGDVSAAVAADGVVTTLAPAAGIHGGVGRRACRNAAAPPPPPTPAAGSVLLADWVPQVAVLRHASVAAFLTHGGMNSVGDATYAGVPMLCVPLFADQPDNCARVADRGMGVTLVPSRAGGGEGGVGFVPGAVEGALAEVLAAAPRARAALRAAWLANVAAGGAPRAVAVVEAAAAAGYGAHVRAVPASYLLPWYEQGGMDVAVVAMLLAWLVLRCAAGAWRACRHSTGVRA